MRAASLLIFMILQAVTINFKTTNEIFNIHYLKESAVYLGDLNLNFNTNLSLVTVDGIKKQGSYIYNMTCKTLSSFPKLIVGSLLFKNFDKNNSFYNQKLQFHVKVATGNQKNTRFDNILFNQKINVCRIVGGHGFFIKFVLSAVDKFSNAKFICPFPKGNYWIRNMAFNDTDFPNIFPDSSIRLFLSAYGSVVGQKFIKEIFNLDLLIKIQRN